MRKILATIILALVVIALSISLVAAQADEGVIEEVFYETENIRGLKAPADVAVDFMTREQLGERMLEEFEEENPEDEIRTAEEIMVLLGFIDKDLDIGQLYIDMYTEQVAGFYDPEDDSLYLISEEEAMGPMDRYILSHELTHYLQDQNFDLMRPPFHDPEDAVEETDDDASFAATCLIEGDAVLTSEIYLTENIDVTDLLDLELESGEYSTEVYDSAPDYIKDSLMFPYVEGLDFVRYIHGEGGFTAVDEAYGDIPSTTEYIMHPEKYIEGEEVIEVDLPDILGDLGAGWELAYDNVLGEFDVLELFKPYLSRRNSKRAADGWGGNQYQYYRDGAGEQLLVQGYAWDSEEDAQEFASAYVTYLEERFEGEIKEESSRGAWMVWSTDEYRLALKRDGINTYLVQATADEPFDVAVGALGDEGGEIEEGALEAEEEKDEEKDYKWLVIGGVVGLLVLGLILVVAMLLLYRRPPTPPSQPPGGPYIYPGGGPGGAEPPGGSLGEGSQMTPGPGGDLPPQPPPVPPPAPPT